ncbi:MAG: DPP IV N-terminal domain-containing protein, partial [Actinobacteria bacterium]|nr:DPP IV N-terminal domain-containing protein [Actinomycetota bacterium]
MTPPPSESFPRRSARTQRFTLGRPRTFAVAADGSRVAFLRSKAGDDAVTCLWALDIPGGEERLIADPRALGARGDAELPPEERARRERAREGAGGVVAYSCDRALRMAAFALGGELFLADLTTGAVDGVVTPGPVNDPRLDPTGARIAFVCDGDLYADGTKLAADDDPAVTWGLPEFIAAEEMGRFRGYWWSPSGDAIAVARVDNRPVDVWHIADPAHPDRAPTAVRYPGAGTNNADVSLHVVSLDGTSVEVRWDRREFPYLVEVVWQAGRPLTFLVMARDQRRTQVRTADVATGATALVFEDTDEHWVEIVDGSPRWLDDGRLVKVAERDGWRRVLVNDTAITPDGMQVRAVRAVGADVVFTASQDPLETHVWRYAADGRLSRLTDEPGWHDAAMGGETAVVVSASMDADARVVVTAGEWRHEIASVAESPGLDLRVTHAAVGTRELRTALLLPAGHHEPDSLPVLMDPYGGPHGQRVMKTRAAYYASQWLADQGFAVIVADGRGMPGRGSAWERAVAGDLAGPPLEDQVDALHGVAALHPELDVHRVGIRGWSFGGYLAALAVLRRPDVFHAAVAGAPVTDWRLYDTHYTERYLGTPQEQPDSYERTSLIPDAPKLERPLLIIHGLADDNVVSAHTLRMSSALLAAGRSHSVLPL